MQFPTLRGSEGYGRVSPYVARGPRGPGPTQEDQALGGWASRASEAFGVGGSSLMSFLSLQTQIADHVELRMLTALRFSEMATQLKSIQNLNTPFGKGFSDALDQFADKAFKT